MMKSDHRGESTTDLELEGRNHVPQRWLLALVVGSVVLATGCVPEAGPPQPAVESDDLGCADFDGEHAAGLVLASAPDLNPTGARPIEMVAELIDVEYDYGTCTYSEVSPISNDGYCNAGAFHQSGQGGYLVALWRGKWNTPSMTWLGCNRFPYHGHHAGVLRYFWVTCDGAFDEVGLYADMLLDEPGVEPDENGFVPPVYIYCGAPRPWWWPSGCLPGHIDPFFEGCCMPSDRYEAECPRCLVDAATMTREEVVACWRSGGGSDDGEAGEDLHQAAQPHRGLSTRLPALETP